MTKFKQPLNKLWQAISNLPTKWYLTITVVIAAAVRLISLTKSNIWHDEGFTMMLIKHDIVDIIARTARDVHPPLYYILTHWWSSLLGDSEFAIRSFSLLCGIGIVILSYFIVKRLNFSETTARLATLFVAIGPFLIRYSQEARMYSMAALLVVLATLVLLIAFDKKHTAKKRMLWWLFYGLFMALALYTHYYVAFIVPVHIGLAVWKFGGIMPLIKDRNWWAGNLLAAVLFMPWIPTVLSQFNRVQSGFWIPPVDAETLPNTLIQFLTFGSNILPSVIEMLILIAFVCVLTVAIYSTKKKSGLVFLTAWMSVPLLIVLIISLKQPVYYDRYFVYSSVAFYIILAAIAMHKRLRPWIRNSLIALVCITSTIGIYNVFDQANHQMGTIGNYVSANYQPGDVLVSGELYTYFDFSYYNKTNQPVKLLSDKPLSGYGETSLLYDKQNEIVVNKLSDIKPQTDQKRVWVIGKTGQHDYYNQDIPLTWKLLDQRQAGDSAVRLYSLK